MKAEVCIQNTERVMDLKKYTSAASTLINTGTFTCTPSNGSEYLSNVSATKADLIARPGSPETKRSEAQRWERENEMLTFREKIRGRCRGPIGSGLP